MGHISMTILTSTGSVLNDNQHEVLLSMLPIFTMIAIGSLFVLRVWFSAGGLPILNRFAMSARIPVLLSSAITNRQSLSDFSWLNAFTYATASLVSA